MTLTGITFTPEPDKGLVELLEFEVRSNMGVVQDAVDQACRRNLVKALAQRLASRFAHRDSGWVNVKDRLPEDEGVFWVWNSYIKRAFEADFMKSDGWVCVMSSRVTHWQPLPPPPEEKP